MLCFRKDVALWKGDARFSSKFRGTEEALEDGAREWAVKVYSCLHCYQSLYEWLCLFMQQVARIVVSCLLCNACSVIEAACLPYQLKIIFANIL